MRFDGVMGGLRCRGKIAETHVVTSSYGGKGGKSRGNSSPHSFGW